MSKKRIVHFICCLAALFMLSGCAMTMTPATGFIFTETVGPYHATSSTGGFTKVGTSRLTSVLGIVATGDASIDAAMKNGNIKKVHHVDYKTKSILGVYAELTTVVYGD